MNAFFIEPEAWPAGLDQPLLPLEGAEAQHMLTVLRCRPGEEVWCFDGQGGWGLFRIAKAEKRRAWLQPLTLHREPRPERRAVLALAWTKGLRRSWLFEKAVELEAGGLWLWQAARSQGQVPADGKDSWRGQCIAGGKQSKNPWLPDLATLPRGAAELAEALPAFSHSYLLWEDADEAAMVLSPEALQRAERPLFVLGPEGGFTPAEVDHLRGAGALPVSLGRRVLRWETAALLCLGLAWWARQQPHLRPLAGMIDSTGEGP